MGKIHYHLPRDFLWNALHEGIKRFQRTVFMIGWLIKLRYVDAGNAGSFFQKFPPAASGAFAFFIKIHQFIVDRLPFPDIKQIKEGSQGFRVGDTGTAADYQGILPGSVF